jgi:glycosyltransferase involved in cell wall biosynthesis
MIDIIAVTYNRARITRIWLEELQARTFSTFQLHVFDNGSTDETRDVLKHFAGLGVITSVIFSDENKGISYGYNALLDLVSTPYFISTDNDIVFPVPTREGDWIQRLINLTYFTFPAYGAIACRPHVFIGDSQKTYDASPEPVIEKSHCGGVGRIMRTDVVKKHQWSTTIVGPSKTESHHICGKIKSEGYKVGYARDIKTIHLFGLDEQGEDPWGYPPGLEHDHQDRHPPVNHYSWDRMGVNWETCQ